MSIHDLVVVWPNDGLRASYHEDMAAVKDALRWLGFATIEGTISSGSALDMRGFGAKFLGRLSIDGAVSVITPGIAIDIPTTLYALQYARRITQIGRVAVDSATKEKLRRRRYQEMIGRFQAIMTLHLEANDAKGHDHQVHFTSVQDLGKTLEAIVPQG